MRAVSPSRPSDTMRKPDLPSWALARDSKVSLRALCTDGSNALDGGFGSLACGGSDTQPAARMTPRNAIARNRTGRIGQGTPIRRLVYSHGGVLKREMTRAMTCPRMRVWEWHESDPFRGAARRGARF